MEPIKILIADDHTMFRHTLRKALDSKRHLQVVEEAADGGEAFEKCQQTLPDVVIMDLQMPRYDGLQAIRSIREEYPDMGIIALTMHEEDDYLLGAIHAGVDAYVLKTSSLQNLVGYIKDIITGQGVLDPTVAKRVMNEFTKLTKPVPSKDTHSLTARETEILQLLARGRTPIEIAHKLFISHKTVRNHISNIYTKLDCHDRTQAILKGRRLGIIKTEH